MNNDTSEKITAYSCIFFSVQGMATEWAGRSVEYDTFVMLDDTGGHNNQWDKRCMESKIAAGVLKSEPEYMSVMIKSYAPIDPNDWLDDYQILV